MPIGVPCFIFATSTLGAKNNKIKEPKRDDTSLNQ